MCFRHAQFYADLLRLHPTPGSIFGHRNVSPYAPHLSNLRAALEWSFSGQGDPAIGTALAAGVAPLFLDLGLLGECRHWVEQGLGALDPSERGGHREMIFHEALAVSSMFTRGNSEDVRLAIGRGLALAEALDDKPHQLDLLAGLSIFLARTGRVAEALADAQRCVAVAGQLGAAPGIVMSVDSGCSPLIWSATSRHFRHLRLGFELEATSGASPIGVFGNDHRIRALIRRWPGRSGCADAPAQAMGTVQVALPEADPIRLSGADLHGPDLHQHHLHLVRRPGTGGGGRRSTGPVCVEARPWALRRRRARTAGRTPDLAGVPCRRNQMLARRAATDACGAVQYSPDPSTVALAEGLARAGQPEEALVTIDRALAQAGEIGETLYTAELLRVRGEILLSMPQPGLAEVERVLTDALSWARKHAALSWELRAAMAMARLYSERGQPEEAAAIIEQTLKSVLRRVWNLRPDRGQQAS